MARTKKRKKVAEINVVPYIDVMLVLLIIFMATTPLLTPGVDVDLPKGDATPISADEFEEIEPFIVTIDAKGLIYLNQSEDPESPVSDEFMLRQARAVLGFEPRTRVLLRGDQDTRHGRISAVMVMLQQAGASKVGILTQPTDAPAAAVGEA